LEGGKKCGRLSHCCGGDSGKITVELMVVRVAFMPGVKDFIEF
jgi:hypothetical protein